MKLIAPTGRRLALLSIQSPTLRNRYVHGPSLPDCRRRGDRQYRLGGARVGQYLHRDLRTVEGSKIEPVAFPSETLTSHGWRCECGFDEFGEVKKALVRKKQLTWL